jgi:hypothetical protein
MPTWSVIAGSSVWTMRGLLLDALYTDTGRRPIVIAGLSERLGIAPDQLDALGVVAHAAVHEERRGLGVQGDEGAVQATQGSHHPRADCPEFGVRLAWASPFRCPLDGGEPR